MKNNIKKQSCIFFILNLLTLFSCNLSLSLEEKIPPVTLQINFNKLTDEKLFHIYFQNQNDKKHSIGFDYFDLSVSPDFSIFPGIYNIYIYGLNDKSSTTEKIYSYKIIRSVEIFSSKEIVVEPVKLNPEFKIEKTTDSTYKIYIMMNDLYEIFSLSSFSLKQGQEKLKSMDIDYSTDKQCYISYVPNIYGSWYGNFSYSLRSKIDDEILKHDGITISTSYFSNIYMGDF
jgi:hypothetical protein